MANEIPKMYKILIDGKPYLGNVKKFEFSKDLAFAALVTQDNRVIVYSLT